MIRYTVFFLCLLLPLGIIAADQNKAPEWASALPWDESLEKCEIQMAKGVDPVTRKHYDIVRIYHPEKGYTYTVFKRKYNKKWEYAGRMKGRMWVDLVEEKDAKEAPTEKS